MHLKNSFSHETRELFEDFFHCIWCSQNRWDAIHHILGRISNSPYNAAPIHNLKCHIGNFALDSFESQARFLQGTKKYLDKIGYVPTKDDKIFLERYSRMYDY